MDGNMRKVYKTVYCLKPPNGTTNNKVTIIERKNGFVTIGIYSENMRPLAYFRRRKSESTENIKVYKNFQQNANKIFHRRTISRRRKRRKINWPTETLKKIFEATNKLNEKLLSIFKINFVKQGHILKNGFNQIKGKVEKDESTREGTANCEDGQFVDVFKDESCKEESYKEGSYKEESYKEDISGVQESSKEECVQKESILEVISQETDKKEKITKDESSKESAKESGNEKESNEDTDKKKFIEKEETAQEEIAQEETAQEETAQEETDRAETAREESVKRETFRVVSNLEEMNFTATNKRGYAKRRRLRKKKLKHYCCRYISDNEDNISTDFQDYENEQKGRNTLISKNESAYMYGTYGNILSSSVYPELNKINFICNPNILNDFNNFNNTNMIRHLQDIGKAGNVDSINMGTNFNRGIFFEASSKIANFKNGYIQNIKNIQNGNKFMYVNNMQSFALNNQRLLEINKTMNQNMQKDAVFNRWAKYNTGQNKIVDRENINNIFTLPTQDSQNTYLEKNNMEKGKASQEGELQNVKYYYVSTVSKKTKKRKLRKVSLIELCKEPHFFISEHFLSNMESYLVLNHCLMYVQKNQNKMAKIHDNFFSTLINIDDVTFLGQKVSTSILRLIMKRFKSLFQLPIDNIKEIEFCLYIKGEENKREEEKDLHFKEHNIYKYCIIIFLNTKISSFIDFPNRGLKIILVLGNCLIYECNKSDDINPFKFNILDDKICFLKLNMTQDLQLHEIFVNQRERKDDVITDINCEEDLNNMNSNRLSDITRSNNSNNTSINNRNTNTYTVDNDCISTTADLLKQPKLEHISNQHSVTNMTDNYPDILSNNKGNIFKQNFLNNMSKNQHLVQKSVDQINNSFRLLNMGSMQKLLFNNVDHTKHIHSTMIQNYWNQKKGPTNVMYGKH